MKILALADEELMSFWDYYVPGRLKEYDLILSSGDLKAAYLSFIVTMARAPLMYVPGNHDTGYATKEPERNVHKPPICVCCFLHFESPPDFVISIRLS